MNQKEQMSAINKPETSISGTKFSKSNELPGGPVKFGTVDLHYSDKYWRSLKYSGMDVEKIRKAMERDVLGMLQTNGEIRFNFDPNTPLESARAKMAAARVLANNLGFRMSDYCTDDESGFSASHIIYSSHDEISAVIRKHVKERGKQSALTDSQADDLQVKQIHGEIPEPEIRASIIPENFDINVAGSLETLKAFAKTEKPESQGVYENSLQQVMEVLKSEKGIVEPDPNVSTVVVSDIHARRDFLVALLERKIKISGQEEMVFDLLDQGKINIVCVGDGMHSEASSRWGPSEYTYDEKGQKIGISEYGRAAADFNKTWKQLGEKIYPGIHYSFYSDEQLDEIKSALNKSTDLNIVELTERYKNLHEQESKKALNEEMARGFGVMKMIMDLKVKYPRHFHFLRGNHDDMDANIVGGVAKGGINQTEEVFSWAKNNFGIGFVKEWTDFEDNLPLLAKGKNYVATHAAPSAVFPREKIESRDEQSAVGLMWTENRPGKEGAIPENQIQESMQGNLRELEMPEDTVWIAGHRPVAGAEPYFSQCSGKFVQINDDRGFVVAYIPSKGVFVPEKHVIDLKKPKEN